jgi:predicted ester cyclase
MGVMPTEELKVRARRLPDELLTQGDLAVADEFLAVDCVHHSPAPLLPGVEGVKQWVRTLRRAFPDLRAIVEDEIAEGDTVVQRLTLSGTHAGKFLGIAPTGRRVAWQLVAIQRLGRDGKFAEHWSSPDLFGLLRQLGALPVATGEDDP